MISVFILSVAVFYVARLAPGDPLISYYGDRTEKMSPEEREWAMEKLGLNEPISVQYVKWVKNAFHGEFGISFKYKQDVLEVICEAGASESLDVIDDEGLGFDPADGSDHGRAHVAVIFLGEVLASQVKRPTGLAAADDPDTVTVYGQL